MFYTSQRAPEVGEYLSAPAERCIFEPQHVSIYGHCKDLNIEVKSLITERDHGTINNRKRKIDENHGIAWKKPRLALAKSFGTDLPNAPGAKRVKLKFSIPRKTYDFVTGIDIGVRTLSLVTRNLATDRVMFHRSVDLLEEAFFLVEQSTESSIVDKFASFAKLYKKHARTIDHSGELTPTDEVHECILKTMSATKSLTRMERVHLLWAIRWKYQATFFHPRAFVVVESQMHEPHVSLQFTLCTILANRCEILPARSVKTFFGIDPDAVGKRCIAEHQQRKTHVINNKGHFTESTLYAVRKKMMVEKAVLGFQESWLQKCYTKKTMTDPAEACLFTKLISMVSSASSTPKPPSKNVDNHDNMGTCVENPINLDL